MTSPILNPISRKPLTARSQPVIRKPNTQPQFSGVGDMVSSFIGLIDRNRVAELVASDGLGMLAPRTAVATGVRGVDDGRETLIREGAGLVCVALLAGLSNQFMIQALGNRVGLYNPHGTPAKAWIGAQNLRVLSERYQKTLMERPAQSIEGVRKAFLADILNGLESGDHQLSLEGRMTTLKALPAKAQEPVLKEMLKALAIPVERHADYQRLLQQNQFGALQKMLRAAGWGKLSQQGKEALSDWLTPKTVDGKGLISSALKGTTPFDKLATQRVQTLNPGLAKTAPEFQKAFLTERLNMGLSQLQHAEAPFVKAVDDLALRHGLTSVVNLRAASGAGDLLLTGQSRQTLLKELKAFLEHYVDRAGYAVTQQGAKPWLMQRQLLWKTLFAPSQSWAAKLLPQAADGLVTATLKTKNAYTWLPITIAIAANGATTFLNNYVTQKKHGGKVFFPGEEARVFQSAGLKGRQA